MTGVDSVFSWLAPAVLLISALLTAGYLMTITIHGFFPRKDENGKTPFFENCEPTHVMLIPLILLATLSVVAGMFPGGLIELFTNIAASLM